MIGARAIPFAALLAFGACTAAPAMPDGDGRGLLHADSEPPPGAATYERPEWRVGDAMTLVRGGLHRAEFTVESIDDGGYFVRGPGGARLRRDRDLGNLGEWQPDADEPRHLLAPVDVRFHWPLWIGKRWRCEFVDRLPGRPALRTVASYEVEDLDTVTVAAGTFEALRIVRRVQLADAVGRVPMRAQVIWYAPSIGLEVRQILADTEVELVSFTQAPRP